MGGGLSVAGAIWDGDLAGESVQVADAGESGTVDLGPGAVEACAEEVAGYVEGTGLMPVCLSEPMGSALGARAYFLFDGKKKVAKEKATPGSAPGCARSLALLGRPGGWLNSPSAQTTPADCPRPACVAQRLSGGPGKSSQHDHTATPTACCGRRPRKGRNQDQQNSSSARAVFPGPLGGAEQRRNAGGSRRALFEGRSPELRSRPAFRVAQGIPAGDTDPGVAFSLATFFWPHKRKYARASGAEPQANSNK